jgi:protein phosphatase
VSALQETFEQRAADARKYVDAYRRYIWEVKETSDLRFAPFHVMATEGAVHTERTHAWHMEVLQSLVDAGGEALFATETRDVDLTDDESVAAATAWWMERTAGGSEGMVVKPPHVVEHGSKGLAQPAVKCRGREYLRIIYGPSYTEPANLERLRKRGLGRKRSMARREFALGVEGLERFVRREPLRRVHECVFGVLALESEPVDPRL